MGSIHTVLGPIEPRQLGITQMHEHVLIDLIRTSGSTAATSEEQARWEESITLANAYEVRREIGWFAENLQLDDVDLAIDELGAFASAGGSTIVDLTTIDLGRRPHDLARISSEMG